MKSLSALLTPDYMFDTYDCVTPEFLASIGIKALLIDIDNTLAPYEQDEPDGKIREWFDALSAADIKAALISNNHPPRVELFKHGFVVVPVADREHSGCISYSDHLFACQLIVNISCERGEKSNVFYVRFAIQHRLIVMRNAPTHGNVKLK